MSVFEVDNHDIYNNIEQRLRDELIQQLPADDQYLKVRINEYVISIKYLSPVPVYMPESLSTPLCDLLPDHKVYIYNDTGKLVLSSGILNRLPRQIYLLSPNIQLDLKKPVTNTVLSNTDQNYRIRVNLLSESTHHIEINSKRIDIWKYVNTPGKQTASLGKIKLRTEHLMAVYENPGRFTLPEQIGDLNIQYDVPPKIIGVRTLYSSSPKYIV